VTEQQSHDILNFRFRKIGQKDYELRITHFLLRQPSVEAPNRKRIIQTFSGRSNNDGITARKRQKSHSFSHEKIHYSRKTDRPIDKPGE